MKTKRLLLAALAVLACGGMVFDGTKGVAGAGYDLKPAAAEKKDATSMATNLEPETDTTSFTLINTVALTREDQFFDGCRTITNASYNYDFTLGSSFVLPATYTYGVILLDVNSSGANAADLFGLTYWFNNTDPMSIDKSVIDCGSDANGFDGSFDNYETPIYGKTSSGKRYVALSNTNSDSDMSITMWNEYAGFTYTSLLTNFIPKTLTAKVYGFKAAGTPLKSGGTQNIYEDIDHAADFDTIKSSIKAYDLFGAECTVNVTDTEKAKYNPNKIGAYDVQITASDTYGQTATATLHIVVYDQTKPVIALASGKSLTFNIDHDTLKVTDLPSYFTITDNASSKGGTIGTPVYKWDGTVFAADKVFSKTDKGTHTIIVDVKDSSGNEATTSFTATVKDVDAPVLARRDGGDVAAAIKVGLSRTFDLTKASFLSLYKATDAVDGDVSSTLAIVGDFIPTHVGSYTVTIKANDTSSNASTQAIAITVIADIPPVFILGTDLVLTHTNTALNTTQIAAIVTNGILMGKTVVNINSLNTGSYIGNESTVGDYTISYNVDVASSGTAASATVNTKKMAETPTTNIQGSFDLRVLAAEDDAKDDDAKTETHWYDGIVTFFTKTIPEFWQKLGNWFRGVFTKWKFDCFITNEAWDVRFADSVKDSAADSSASVAVSDATSTSEVAA